MGFRAWDKEDSMMMPWLWNSMKLEISKNLMSFATARAIWENLQQTYSKKKDTTLTYKLKIQVGSTKGACLLSIITIGWQDYG